MSSSYFSHPYLSNSRLSALRSELSGKDQHDPSKSYAMGSLVDALITNRGKINHTLKLCDGKPYTDNEMRVAKRCESAFMANAICRGIYTGSELQKEFYTEGCDFEFNGFCFELDCKAMMDGYKHLSEMGWDLKTTDARTQKDFEIACQHFDYDRQAAFYMMVGKLKRFMFMGVSKKTAAVFLVPVESGSQWHQSGVEKMSELAFKYIMLK